MITRLFFIALLGFVLSGLTPLSAEPASVASVGTLHSNGIRHVDVTQAHTLITNNPDIVVLDVRTGREFRNGHIQGASNINYFSLSFRRQVGELDPSKTYLVHCKSGHRSGRAAPIMKNAGITTVIHMDGGFDAWKEAALPVSTQ